MEFSSAPLEGTCLKMASSSRSNESVNLRKRHQQKKESRFVNNSSSESDKYQQKGHGGGKLLSGPVVIVLSIIFYSSSVLLVHFRMNSFPTPVQAKSPTDKYFAEERARKHLIEITGYGPRVTGSIANTQAEHYLVSELNKIHELRNPIHDVDVDVQTVSGSFVLDFINIGEFTSVYSNLTNVIAMLSSAKEKSKHSVLINCHYDSVADSPGASDDAVSCTLMLEIIRALSQREKPLTHNIIFLFNGAEENILQASHGFITQHRWAKTVKAFVNLDSAGAGGWELVFQTGPEHPWLVRAYTKSAKYPCGSAVSQEIFQSGLVPSDTDYRVFRDYGNIPGLDIAHVKNGYVYHTLNDGPNMVQEGCLQRGGENLQELLVTLAESSQVVDPGEDKHGNMVYFDFIGYIMVSYPQRVGLLINWAVVAVVVLSIIRKMSSDLDNPGFPAYIVHLCGAIMSLMVTWAAVVTCALTMALILHALGREMSWYSNIHNISWLFILPGVAGGIAVNLFLKKNMYSDWDPWKVESLFFDANLLLISIILSILTFHNIMSAYVLLLWVLFPVIIRDRVGRLLKINFSENHKAYYVLTFVSLFVPGFYTVYLNYTMIHFFIPIMGRIGKVIIPDVPISIITSLPVFLATGSQAGMVYPCRKMGRMCAGLVLVSLLGLFLVVSTPLGFPYTVDSERGSLQRTIVMHIDRRFIDQSQRVTKEDSSLWYIPFDYHGERSIKKAVPELFKDARAVSCDGVYCGRPYLYPILPIFDAVHCLDFPAPRLNLTHRLTASVARREKIGIDKVRLHFVVTGPDHMNCYIMPRPNVRVTWWSVSSYDPQPIKTNHFLKQPTYFLYHAHGKETTESWNFTVEFYVSQKKKASEPIVDVGFAGHYLHGVQQKTADMKRFVSMLPKWSVPAGWSSTYDMYTI